MALFVLTCFDKPDSIELRMATREAHLAFVRERAATVKVTGPLLDASEAMAGSLFILEADDRAQVKVFNAADPYQKAGLFGQVEIRGIRASIGQL